MNLRGATKEMIPKATHMGNWTLLKPLIMMGLGLGFGVGAGTVHAQQNQPNEVQAAPAPPDSQAQGQLDPGVQPQPDAQPGAQLQGQPDPQAQGQPNQAVRPQTLTLPAGTVIRVRSDAWVSRRRSVMGASFSGELAGTPVRDGWEVARKRQAKTGR